MSIRLSARHRGTVLHAPLFSGLPPELRSLLLDTAQVIQLSRGQALFHQGDTGHAIHIVLDGWIKLYRITANGTEAVVDVMTRGQSFGEPIALRGATYPVSAEAASSCDLIAVPASVLLDLIQSRPEVAISILSSTFMHLHGLVQQIEQLKARSGAQRVAEFLVSLCPSDAESATVILPYDKILIAGKLGMKPESLSRAFARLRDHGVRVNQTSAAIASVSRLRELTDADGYGLYSGVI